MQVAVAVRAAGDRIVDGVWPALCQRAHMVYLQIRFTVITLERGFITAGITGPGGLLKHPRDYVRIPDKAFR
tara:strand:+ start:288 stop:503 length:216 start_codon:yes stop_codon:yes gene_type:complete